MEGSSSLLSIWTQNPPLKRGAIPLLPSSSSLYFLSLALPAAKGCRRGASLIARADLPEAGKEPSSGDTEKPSGKGATGFGSVTQTKKKKGRGKERSAVIRRSPIEKPFPLDESRSSGRQESVNESAFLLTWLGLGFLILVEGVALAASGFLPEEWDNFFVKYLYPSFTPTVFLFVGGTVAYGVVKYLQGEKMKS